MKPERVNRRIKSINKSNYYMLRSSLQILRSAVLDDRTSRADDLKSGSVLSRGSIISKRPHLFECIHVTCA